MFQPELTPAQHVARREALAQMGRGQDYKRAIQDLNRDIIAPLNRQFFAGRRLDGADFEGTVSRIRAIISGYGPAILLENRRPATRARPKGEEHEFLSLVRAAGAPEFGQSGYELAGLRLHLTRRRVGFNQESNGVMITRHLLERSIERGLASWTGRLAEVEDAVLERLGLAMIWRHALETNRTGDARIALPCRSGLIYGTMAHQPVPRPSWSMAISQARVDRSTKDLNRWK